MSLSEKNVVSLLPLSKCPGPVPYGSLWLVVCTPWVFALQSFCPSASAPSESLRSLLSTSFLPFAFSFPALSNIQSGLWVKLGQRCQTEHEGRGEEDLGAGGSQDPGQLLSPETRVAVVLEASLGRFSADCHFHSPVLVCRE